MKKIYLLFALVISNFIDAQTPTFTWAKQFSGLNDQQGQSVAVDGSGNVITVGEFGDVADFDPGAGTFTLSPGSNYDAFISKVDAFGNFVWAKQIGINTTGDFAYDVAVDGSGNIYLTGYFNGTSDFDPGAGVYNLTAPSFQQEVFICKLNSLGNFIWAKQIGGTQQDWAYSIAVDATNNVYTTGFFSGVADFDPGAGIFNMTSSGPTDIFVSKLDGSGNFVWAKQFAGGGTNFSVGRGISVDASGNVYTTGNFIGTIDFDPGAGLFNMTHSNSQDVFISKLDASGAFVWAKQINGSGSGGAYGKDIVVDGNNVYTTGFFSGTGDFDPGAGTFNLTASGLARDVFVSKLSNAGNFVWAKSLAGNGSACGNGIALDVSGNVYTTGYFQSTADFDPGAGTFNLTSLSTNSAFMSKLDPSGNYLWAGQVVGAGTGSGANGIVVDGINNFYTTGYFYSTLDFDAGAGTVNMTSLGGQDVFVTKYNSCPTTSQPGPISGSTNLCVGAGATTYSIATVVGATSYTWSLPGGWSGSSSTNTISATPGSSGTISVTASNTCGTSSAQNLTVTINALPTIVYTQNPDTVCANAGIVALGSVTPTGGTFSGTAVSGTNFNATTAGAGTFTITYTYTDGNSCTNTASQSILVDLCTGLSNQTLAESDFIVFPNPANELVTITSNENKGQLIIYNTLGAVLYSKQLNATQTTVDVSAYQSGIYFIQIQTVDGMATKKIIKQ